jgi:hypothetical protein
MEGGAAAGGAAHPERAAPDNLIILRTKGGLPAAKTIGRGPDGLPAIVAGYAAGKHF